jgi:LL-diaminopimelate aminotransferase
MALTLAAQRFARAVARFQGGRYIERTTPLRRDTVRSRCAFAVRIHLFSIECPVLPRPIAALTSLPPYVFAELDRLKQDARARGVAFTDLGIGSPDRPIASPIVDVLADAMRDPAGHGYPPFRGAPRYLTAAANFMRDRFGLSVDPATQVLALSGSKEGLAQVAMVYCGPGDIALVPDVHYPVHARAPLLNGAEVHYLATSAASGFLPDFDRVPADIARRAKLVVVNYPNNPTGATATREFYARAVAFAKANDLVLVSDLAYSELTFDGSVAPSVFEIDGAMDVAVEFYSCSKTFSMAGMRIGFVVGNAEIIDAIAAYRTNVGYGTPVAVQHAAAYALENHRTLVPAVRDRYQARRDVVVNAFREAGWPIPVPSASMYVWLPVPEGFTDWSWTRAVLDQAEVVVTPGLAFGPGGEGYFRISLVADEVTLANAITRLAGVAQKSPV